MFVDDDSDLRATAVREFNEELGFGQENVDIDVSSLQEIHSECSGKYKYFAVELSSHQLRNLDLERINQDIAAFEQGSDLQTILTELGENSSQEPDFLKCT
jgi:8-oxo-dGTP pyrophosphatase MutT (NUDIX family)